ncbi:MAG TPA: hypothetical protein VMS12_13075 [Thermoanaerobaculia bacterium]|nr:hypothetical protein [Thermoanaerobaculia bacterium]
MKRSLYIPFFLIFLLFSLPAASQLPSADWQTLETEHFRFHFPAEYEAWTRLAAGRMESIRTRLIEDIGYTPPQTIDVLVMDPMSQANGFAWPFLSNARMVLWTNPPGPESVIGNFADWAELLTVHEQAHLVHLMRPSRNPMQRWLSRVLPFGPIGVRSPRWVSEGYATVLEGDFTGSGRPNSAIRASILRKWAQAGALPSYAQMASDSSTFMGMSMAYLMGSAYLEWLRDREGPDSLRTLWSRLTARQVRSFDAAFAGVYGDSPRILYDRFVAELTHSALEIEQGQRPFLREGELWQDFKWSTGEPAVSADGERLVTVIRHRELPERLVVLSTEDNTKAEEKWQEQVTKLLERDPEDVPAVRRRPLPREPLDQLAARDRTEHFLTLRWIGGGQSILFGRFEPDHQGQLHPDLYRWTPGEGSIVRLTHGAGVRDADPSPDGSWAVGVRNRHGMSQLVRVDLSSGAVEAITPASLTEIYDGPRISPDGKRIVYVRHSELAWRLLLRELDTGAERVLQLSGDSGSYSIAQPAWSVDGTSIYASMFRNGFIDLVQVSPETGSFETITTTRGAAFAPAPSADGVYFLALESDGLDIRFLDATSLPGASFMLAEPAWPLAGAPEARVVVPFEVAELGPARPYGIGRQELSLLLGGSHSPASDMFEAGLRMGDVLGRSSVLLLGSLGGRRGFEGAALAGSWRGWPVELSGHLFASDEEFSTDNPQLAGGLERTGAELGALWSRVWRNRRFEVGGGILLQSVYGLGIDDQQGAIHLSPELRGRLGFGSWHLSYGTSAWLQSGRTGDESWQRLIGKGMLGVNAGDTSIVVAYERGSVDGDASAVDRFEIGGWRPSLMPVSALAGRVVVPALEARTLTGSEFESQSADLALEGFPLSAFFERHRAFEEGASAGDWLELAGLRLNVSTETLPLLGTAGIDLQLGVARILTAPLEDETNWWVTMAWRP